MASYAHGTKVPVSQSKTEIERVLARYGADQFMYGTADDRAVIQFRAHDRHIKFVLPLDGCNPREERRRWRCLVLVIKSKLESVATKIVEFEDEFMAHIVMPDGQTFAEHARPAIAAAYLDGELPRLLPDYTGGGG